MDLSKLEHRSVIKFLTKKGFDAKEILNQMSEVYGESTPSYPTIARWSSEFTRG